jgi:hypothetical protein
MNKVDLTGICKLFEAPIGRGLKRPGLRFIFNGALIFVKKAPEKKSSGQNHPNSGCYYVTREGLYIGKITPSGEFKPSSHFYGSLDSVLDFLQVFADDPVKVASEYGRKTGVCCFCGNPLADGRSLAKGYGPQCAKSWSLAWGDEAEETLKKSEQSDLGSDAPILSMVSVAKRSHTNPE